MQIVLREDIEKVGKRGDIVSVADGYARNYLLPRGHAIVATAGITAQAGSMRVARDRADAKNLAAAQERATKVEGTSVTLSERASNEGKLFGSVTAAEIVVALAEQASIEVERRQIVLNKPIRETGSHAVPVRLHTDVLANITVEVVAATE